MICVGRNGEDCFYISNMKKKKDIITNDKFLTDIIGIISQAKTNAIRSVDFERVTMY
jgi:hypothetical protein